MPNVRMPDGWNTVQRSGISVYSPGFREARQEPAGDPPDDFPGTRPEWAIYWALNQLGYEENVHFQFTPTVAPMGRGDWSELDFVIPEYGIAFEIQGEFWHHRSSEQVARDLMRGEFVGQFGLTLIYIDEPDALERPIETVKDGLRGIDRSWMKRKI